MRILALQFVAPVRCRAAPRFAPALGALLSLLKERGHELALLGLTHYDEPAIKAALARHLPQMIYADVSCVCVDVARRSLQHVQQREFLPVVAGGTLASVDPDACLSLPGVHAVAVGEPDASLVTYLERLRDPAVGQVVLGVWVRDEHGQVRPSLPPLVEALDSLPHPERDLFHYESHVRATGELEISVGRGCPRRCGYCLNARLADRYSVGDGWTRRRPPEDVLDEIDALRSRYPGARSVRFLDHAFALDEAWLTEFLDAYAARGGPPFRCHLRAGPTPPERATMLARAGMRGADVEVIAGSDFIRNEIFAMDASDEQIVALFDVLRSAGVARRAIVYAGAPYESEASFDLTRRLLRRIAPDALDARPFYPFPGTAAHALCRENGWLHTRGEWQYHNDRCGIDMPACRADRVDAFVRELRAEFAGAARPAWWRRWARGAGERLSQLLQRRR